MPRLPANQLHATPGRFRGASSRSRRFYNGTAGRELVTCPDCGREADPHAGGNHSGTCTR